MWFKRSKLRGQQFATCTYQKYSGALTKESLCVTFLASVTVSVLKNERLQARGGLVPLASYHYPGN